MARIWHAIRHLDFITAFFTWLFMALSRLAEPCMTLSCLYVIIQTGVTRLHSETVYNTAIACMLGAPEIILPGAFVLAGRAYGEGKKRAGGVLYFMAALFVVLTLATLADLFLWRLSGEGLNLLMFARCAVSVGYSIVFRIVTHPTEHATETDTSTPAQPASNATPAPPVNPPGATPASPPAIAQTSATPASAPAPGSAPARVAQDTDALAAIPPASTPATRPASPPDPTPATPPAPAPRSRQAPASASQKSSQARILAYRQKHPRATQSEIAQALNLSLRTVQRYDAREEQAQAQARLHAV